MPSRTPLAWAVSPASARPSVSASSRSKPSRSATTAAHSVSTGARFTRTVPVDAPPGRAPERYRPGGGRRCGEASAG